MLDCGWDGRLDTKLLEPVLEYVDSLNAVLISHPDITHMGGLPYIIKKRSYNLPIYISELAYVHLLLFMNSSTIAVICMEDMYENWLEGAESCVFDRDDIERVANNFQKLTYNQSGIISNDRGVDIAVTPYLFFFLIIHSRRSGHSIGGSIWNIMTDADTLVYSMHINTISDNHLYGADYKIDRKITMLLTNICEDNIRKKDSRQEEIAKFEKFRHLIVSTLQDLHGNVLIPVDTAGRCLEVLLLLERLWEEKQLDYFKVYFLTKRNDSFLKYVRSNSNLLYSNPRNVRDEREAFDLHSITYVSAVEQIPESGCKVVVATMTDLENSYSQIYLNKWCSKQENMLLFIASPSPDTLAWRILNNPQESSFTYVVSKNELFG